MVDLYSDDYGALRSFISNKRKKGKTFDQISDIFNSMSDEEIQVRIEDYDWPEDAKEVFPELIRLFKEEDESEARSAADTVAICDGSSENDLELIKGNDTKWARYEENIRKKLSLKSVSDIDYSTQRILKRLDVDMVDPSKPPKMLAIGYVQSGKTANMAGLIAKAASTDRPINMVFILSGTIENLRYQTSKRMIKDLTAGKPILNPKEHLDKEPWTNEQLRESLKDNSQLFLNVVLKNSNRLRQLVTYLQNIPKDIKSQLRILVIDDEADQAGVNTNKIAETEKEDLSERKAINRNILYLIRSMNPETGKCDNPPKSLNYIAYTATPYACILSDGRMVSLYPDRAVFLLPTSDEYFGPKQYFGECIESPYDVSPAIIMDPEVDTPIIDEGGTATLPPLLKEAIAWFICGVGIIRKNAEEKGILCNQPVSMIVHTSSKTEEHHTTYMLIDDFINKSDKRDLIEFCKEVYLKYTASTRVDFRGQIVENITKSNFRNVYPDYPLEVQKNGEWVRYDLNDYPLFDDIIPYLDTLLSEKAKPIQKRGSRYHYGMGIHLCEDNSLASLIKNGEDVVLRVVYPDEETWTEKPDFPTAFLIVGGNTLSRGLTLEGLISSYFSRGATYADSLMQMGRWFGFRSGYELIPRVFLSPDSVKAFKDAIDGDEKLREKIEGLGPSWTPRDVAVGISANFKGSRIKGMTATNKTRGAIRESSSYGGAIHENKIEMPCNFDYNRKVLDGFISLLKESEFDYEIRGSKQDKTRYLWRDVPNDIVIKAWLSRYLDYEGGQSDALTEFTKWFQDNNTNYGKTNVALIGTTDRSRGNAYVGPEGTGIIAYPSNWKTNEKEYVNVNFAFGDKDLYIDVDINDPASFTVGFSEVNEAKRSLKGTRLARKLRSMSVESNNPLLLIYPVHATFAKGTPEEKSMESILWSYLMPGMVQKDQYVLRTMLEQLDEMEKSDLEDAMEAAANHE